MSRYFNVNNPSQLVTITGEQSSFYQLSDGNMIKKDAFMSKYQPVLEDFESNSTPASTYDASKDFVDPTSFFNITPVINNTEIEKLKNIDPTDINVNDNNRTQVVNKTTERPILNNESLVSQVENITIPNNTNTDVSQYKVYDNDDDAYEDLVRQSKTQQPQQTQQPIKSTVDPMIEINSQYTDELFAYGEEEAMKRKNKRLSRLNSVSEQDNTQQPIEQVGTQEYLKVSPSIPTIPEIDPFKMMFSTFKRNHEVVFNVQFKDKIGKPEFIKMMMENMDGDIIGFYKKMIMDNIMKNLSIIEDVVEKELKNILGEEEIIIEKYNDVSTAPLKKVTEKNVIKRPKISIPDVATISIPKIKKPRTKKPLDDKK